MVFVRPRTKARTGVERLRAANADLKKKLAEALEQQTATSEVLQHHLKLARRVGAGVPAMLAMPCASAKPSSARCISRRRIFRISALHNAPPDFAEERRREPVLRPGPGTGLDRAGRTKRVVQIADIRKEQAYRSDARAIALIKLAGYRTHSSFRCSRKTS